MNILSREEGKSQLTVFFWLFLLFAVVHIGLLLVPMYMDFWRMEDEIISKTTTAQSARPEDIDLQYSLAKYAEDIGLPLKQDNFVVVRNEEQHTIKVSTAWDVELRFFWGICGQNCIRKYHFAPSAEGKY